MKMSKTKMVAFTGIGIALYVVLSMIGTIPLIGNIRLDLGYVVMGVYCALLGSVSGAIVGSAGCAVVSLLTSGWFPPGWFVGNLVIGAILGKGMKSKHAWVQIAWIVVSVVLGIVLIKTVMECWLYAIPFEVKVIKNAVAALADGIALVLSMVVTKGIQKYGFRGV